MIIAFAAVLTNVGFGVIYGSIAGYYGGMVDMVMMRIAEIIQAFPNIVVMTLFIMYFGNGLLLSSWRLLCGTGWEPLR